VVTATDPVTDDLSTEADALDTAVASRPPLPSMIGVTVVMRGELIVGEDLVIEGEFDGTITGEGADTVTVRRTARLSGEVSAGVVQVEDGTNLERTTLSGRIRLAK
jgi:cytoskeletal protein CcmA (bactofilin family)